MSIRCLLAITGAFHLDGGIAAVNRLVIHTLAQRGYQIDLYALSECDATIDERYVPRDQIRYYGCNKSKRVFVSRIWQALVSQHYDLVMADTVNLASAIAPMRQLGKADYVAWLFGIDVFPPRPDWEGKIGMQFARQLLAISEYTRQQVSQRFPHLPIRVCDLALDPVRHPIGSFDSTNSPPQIEMSAVDGIQRSLGKQFILNVGRMVLQERYKGQEALVRAFPHIHARFPNAQLVLAGNGNDREYLLGLARSLPTELQARIFIPGFVPNDLLDRLYRQCFLFAMPSIGEGFGLVYLEAMSRAKPCLGGRRDATPHVVRDGVTGVLVDDPRSADQVAERILYLLERPELAQAMGKAGFERVQSYYLFPHFAERFWRALGEI